MKRESARLVAKVLLLAFAVTVGAVSLVGPVQTTDAAVAEPAPAPKCHSKTCQVNGQDCTCCLVTKGSIDCTPCGSFDCDPALVARVGARGE